MCNNCAFRGNTNTQHYFINFLHGPVVRCPILLSCLISAVTVTVPVQLAAESPRGLNTTEYLHMVNTNSHSPTTNEPTVGSLDFEVLARFRVPDEAITLSD